MVFVTKMSQLLICKLGRGEGVLSRVMKLNTFLRSKYRYAPSNDVSVNDGPHIRRWSHKIIIL
jgi:hypothetical protein